MFKTLLLMLKALRLQVAALAASFALAVNLWLVLHLSIGEDWPLVALLNNMAHWLSMGSVFSFFAAIFAPRPYRRVWMAYALPGMGAFLLWYAPLFLPVNGTAPSENSIALRVATFNVASFNPAAHQREKVALIEEINADIIGLQEASHVALFLQDNPPSYPYLYNAHSYALWSRYPIDESQSYLIYSPPAYTRPVALRSQISVEGQRISVYVVHPLRPTLSIRPLLYDDRERNLGIRDVVASIKNEVHPVIILCDCNMGYRTDDYVALAGVMVDTWRAVGFGLGLTAPAEQKDTPLRLLRSDIIWVSQDIATQAVTLWPEAAHADHRPVVAEIFIPRRDSPRPIKKASGLVPS